MLYCFTPFSLSLKMKVLKVAILLFFQISPHESKILENEQKVLKSLIDHFQIRRCLIINGYEDFTTLTKFLSSNHVFSSFFNIDLLTRYILPDRYPGTLVRDIPTKTAVIWKTSIHMFLVDFSDPLGLSQKFMSPYTWIIITEADQSDFNELKHVYIPYDCLFLIIKPNSHFHYQIFKAYRIKSRVFASTNVDEFGEWDEEYGLASKELKAKPDLHNEQLLLYTYRIDIQLSPVLSKTLEIWYDLGKMMNFSTYEISLNEAEFYGFDTRYNGLDFDAAIIPVSKATFIPMIYPMWLKKVYMHVKYEGDEITHLEALLRPFSFNVWITIVAAHVAATATLIIVEFITLKIYDNQCRTFHFVDSLFAPLEMLFNQGGCDPLDRPSPRITYLSLWIQISILLPAYTGAVVSFLTMTIPQVPFSDLDTFIENGAYKFTGVGNTYMKGYFKLGKIEGDARSTLIHDKFFINASMMPGYLEQGVHQVCSGKKLVLLSYENEAFENLFGVPKCKLLKIPKPIFSMTSGLPLNVLSPFTTAFNKQFTYFRTSGILEKLNRDLSQKRTELQMDDYDPIGFIPIIPSLQFLSILTVLSLLICLCEKMIKNIFWHKRIRLNCLITDSSR